MWINHGKYHDYSTLVRDHLTLTHWGLVTPFGNIDLGQHWLRQWLVAWRDQAITWTNVDLSSVGSSGIHLREISSEMPQPPFTKVSLKITNLKLIWNLPGANELKSTLRGGFERWSFGKVSRSPPYHLLYYSSDGINQDGVGAEEREVGRLCSGPQSDLSQGRMDEVSTGTRNPIH